MNIITQNTKITSTDINTLISELNGKLDLSGGTLTESIKKAAGSIISCTSDASYLSFNGGTDYQHGSRIVLSGKDYSGWNGELQLEAYDGTNKNVLRLFPSGTATLGGKFLVRSVNGVDADEAGNVSDIAASGANYIRFTNGLQIVFAGQNIPANTTAVTITFPAAFKNASYEIIARTSGGVAVIGFASLSPASITCTLESAYTTNYQNLKYFAFGYWK